MLFQPSNELLTSSGFFFFRQIEKTLINQKHYLGHCDYVRHGGVVQGTSVLMLD